VTHDSVDHLVVLTDLPQSSVGAPIPHALLSEESVRLLYLAEVVDPSWDGTTVRVVDASSAEPIVVVTFERPYWTSLGPPNDEAIAGHPLADHGLEPYTAYVVERSSWLAELTRRNQVHPYHLSESFERLQHYAIVFHDSTFECVAEGFGFEVRRGSSMRVVLRDLLDSGG
jgi:hypothetical protein